LFVILIAKQRHSQAEEESRAWRVRSVAIRITGRAIEATPGGELTDIRIEVATRKLTAGNTLQLLGSG